jgi:ribosome-associated translation inhibitor RaiA
MQTPLQIQFRDMKPSPALAETIRASVDKLELHFARIVSCRVVVQAPHEHGHQRLFQVTVDLGIPGRDIVVGRHHADHPSHEDAHLAVRDAFAAAQRVLDEHVEARREAARDR